MPEFTEAANLVRSLVEGRSFKKELLEDDNVASSLQELADVAFGGEGSKRLEAFSVLGKAASVSVPIAEHIIPKLQKASQTKLPPSGGWGTAEDRFYLAKALSLVSVPWLSSYAANELAQEEIGVRKSRQAWAALAVTNADTLSSCLRDVTSSLIEELKGARSPTLVYGKLRYTAAALAEELSTADLPVGPKLGAAIARLASEGNVPISQDIELSRLREAAAVALLGLVIQLLRFQFEALFDLDFYRGVGAIRGWWRPARPPKEIEEQSDRIAHLAVRSLHILARQGIEDNTLRQAISASLTPERLNSIASTVASNDPSLSPRSSQWLSTGRAIDQRQGSEDIQRLNERDLDEALSQLLLSIDHVDDAPTSLEGIANQLDVFDPDAASVIRSRARSFKGVLQWARLVVEKRKLEVHGERGALVQFDSNLHEYVGGTARPLTVRIVAPGVVRQIAGRPAEIIKKSVVDKP